MDYESGAPANAISVAFDESSAGSFGAVAYRGSETITVQFHELLETEQDERYWFLKEIRHFAPSYAYPARMPDDELRRRLLNWIKRDFPELPAEEEAQSATPPRFAGLHIKIEDARTSPLGQMLTALDAFDSKREVQFEYSPPTQDDIDILLAHSEHLGFHTRAIAQSHLDQLRAVGAYVTALGARSRAPLQEVAKTLNISHVRARNLINFARTNGYLAGDQTRGRATGFVSVSAAHLSQTARERASYLRSNQEGIAK